MAFKCYIIRECKQFFLGKDICFRFGLNIALKIYISEMVNISFIRVSHRVRGTLQLLVVKYT